MNYLGGAGIEIKIKWIRSLVGTGVLYMYIGGEVRRGRRLFSRAVIAGVRAVTSSVGKRV